MIQNGWDLFGETGEIPVPTTMGRLCLDKPIRYSIKCPNCSASWMAELSDVTSVSRCFLCGETLSKPFGDLLDIVRRLSVTLSKTDDFSLAICDRSHKDDIVDLKVSLEVELKCSTCGAILKCPLEKAPLLEKSVQERCEFRCPNCQRKWSKALLEALNILSDLKAKIEEKRMSTYLVLSNLVTVNHENCQTLKTWKSR